MIIFLLGLIVSFNFLVIIRKFKKGNIADGLIDAILLVIICIVFSGSVAALTMGTIGSFAISIYLWFDPVKIECLDSLNRKKQKQKGEKRKVIQISSQSKVRKLNSNL